MSVYNAVYNFNRMSNKLERLGQFKQPIIMALGGFSLVCASMFLVSPFGKFNFFESDSAVIETNTEYFLLNTPVVPQGVTPPKFSPFEKTDRPVNLNLKLSNSFSDTLLSYGIPQEQIWNIQEIAKPFVNLQRLHNGHNIDITLMKNKSVDLNNIDDSMHVVRKISLYASPGIRLEITGDGEHYKAQTFYDKIYEKSFLASGKITQSIAFDAKKAGATPVMIEQFVKLFSLNVDFRQLQKNDSFEFGFDKFQDKEGNVIAHSKLNYASLTVNGKKHEIYYIPNRDGNGNWINENGMNSKPLLMKTPIDGARLSSGFGLRHHPVLGYTKHHTGIDFAAPTGTPIYAAGDGVIVQKYRSGSYGNYIKIRHNQTFSTAYAHMSRFAKFSVGQRVSQGQVIGYVGTTGRSTGPHLHYEVHQSGIPINPLASKVPTVSSITVAMKNTMAENKNKIVALRSGKTIQTVHNSINDIKYKMN